jgi:hypothetical protein
MDMGEKIMKENSYFERGGVRFAKDATFTPWGWTWPFARIYVSSLGIDIRFPFGRFVIRSEYIVSCDLIQDWLWFSAVRITHTDPQAPSIVQIGSRKPERLMEKLKEYLSKEQN